MAPWRAQPRQTDPQQTATPTGTAEAYALRLLVGRPLSAAQLKERLSEKGFAADAVDAALEAMRHYRYIDDAKYADMLRASAARQGKGPQWIAHTLRRRGIDPGLAREAAQVPADEAQAQAEALIGRRFAGRADAHTPRIRQRALRFLAGRGFSGGCAVAAVKASLGGAAAQDSDENLC
jgi:regulatory protein